ncbi:cellulose binding domain-containing protein [Cellulomonas dongxiuzhuiae]|uniref:cellulose binding domain-containing protein n=1 Tax=Cellulomonas dongxiuzhuiae TaxID=2819979 RepID=UPI001AAE4AC2|nr:cellulose binding domain-containing protein [Cellulomonas dongxiuzhuiae]MBO3089245.1 cellulose binding domain-containing protein [Cellulomonas dongxiuzhuiae]
MRSSGGEDPRGPAPGVPERRRRPLGSLTQAWSAEASAAGSVVTARSTPWNGALRAGGSTVYGFLATGTPPAAGEIPCTDR